MLFNEKDIFDIYVNSCLIYISPKNATQLAPNQIASGKIRTKSEKLEKNTKLQTVNSNKHHTISINTEQPVSALVP